MEILEEKVSDCCNAKVDDNVDVCLECKEPCGTWIETTVTGKAI